MSDEHGQVMAPYLDEGYKLLREKYKCGANEANDLVREFFNHVFYKWPKGRGMKNPRREFLHGLRGWVVQRRKDEKEVAQMNKRRPL
jgi:hypothetical protein